MSDLIKRLHEADLSAIKKACEILDGLPQDAIDGGWTARGISAYAKHLETRVGELNDQLAAAEGLRKDAERYRMIRDFGKDGVDIRPPCVHVHACLYSHPVGAIPVTRAITGAELDAAIDTALAKQQDQS
jgi:hypothetical protein